MDLPKENIIEGVTKIVNRHFNNDGLSFKPHIKKDFCSLIPNKTANNDLKGILIPIRKQYKNIYVWVDSKIKDDTEYHVINFFQKHF